MKKRNRKRAYGKDDGFTILELLVVLLILGLIAAIAAPPLMRQLGRAKTEAARLQIEGLATAIDLFRLDVGRYPTENEGLTAVYTQPPGLERWHGPYITKKESLTDPWGRPYLYRFPGEMSEVDIYTFGADGAPGGTGENQDVGNW